MKRMMSITGLSLSIVVIGAAFLVPNRGEDGAEAEKKVSEKTMIIKKTEEKAVENKTEVKKEEVRKKSVSKVSKRIEFDYSDFGRGMIKDVVLDTLKADSEAVLP